MLQEACKLLKDEYEKCLHCVQHDDFYRKYAQEKWRHSWQVMGAGNYIIAKIEWLKGCDCAYLDMVKTAVLLHDVCRFAEITSLCCAHAKLDHGVAASELLQTIPMFADIRIWLPIKHHGHLIEDLYNDPVYQQIDDLHLKEQVEKICFIIRDADKIANLHMMCNEPDMLFLFTGTSSGDAEKDGSVSDIIKQTAFSGTTVPRNFGMTMSDRMVSFLSWYMDINYKYAIEFCATLGVTEKLVREYQKICRDEPFKSDFLRYFRQYLNEHQFRA